MRFGLIVVVLALFFGAGWWWWTTTPQYSIEQVKDAINAHDLAKFDKYVDLDTTSSKMVDDPTGQTDARSTWTRRFSGAYLLQGLSD